MRRESPVLVLFAALFAALVVGLGGRAVQDAHAGQPARVECKSFYVDFPNGLVTAERAVIKSDELGSKVAPWLTEQFNKGATSVQLHSFVPFGAMGGSELVCVVFPASS